MLSFRIPFPHHLVAIRKSFLFSKSGSIPSTHRQQAILETWKMISALTQYPFASLCHFSCLLVCPVPVSVNLQSSSTSFHGITYRLSTLNYQSIHLIELTDNRLPLSYISKYPEAALHPPSGHPARPDAFPAQPLQVQERVERTFKICNSFKPFCINSCISLSSLTPRCSLNASLVRRFAYSLKLYAANCSPCLNNCRYCHTISPVLCKLNNYIRATGANASTSGDELPETGI